MRNKKNLIIGTICLISMLILLTFLIAPNFILAVITPDINLEDENINSIRLNQNIHEFSKFDISEDLNNPNVYNLSGVRLITDAKGQINNIAITHDAAETVKTSRGITVGDSLEKVKRYYGGDFYSRHEQGVGIIVYVDNNQFLEFWHWNDEVQEIRYGIYGIN